MRWMCLAVWCLQRYHEVLLVLWPWVSTGAEAARTLRRGRLCLHKPVSCGQLRQCPWLEVLWGSGWATPLSPKVDCAGIKRQGWAWAMLSLIQVSSILRLPEQCRHSIPVSYYYWWLYRWSRSKPASSPHDFYPVFLHNLSNQSFPWRPIRYLRITILP